ncbi:hypothetical protein [Ferrimonas marina]|nr:hypothetical protein [Ferrimonas marina]
MKRPLLRHPLQRRMVVPALLLAVSLPLTFLGWPHWSEWQSDLWMAVLLATQSVICLKLGLALCRYIASR